MSFLWRDKRIRAAFGIAILEWVVVGGLVVLAQDQRALVGGVLVLATAVQMGILFWQPRPTGLLPDAQAAFMAGDYVTARMKLETLLQAEEQYLEAQTLLGNVLRQMGELEQSQAVLHQTLQQFPNQHFPLYGLGRTQLALGKFEAAADLMTQALEQGGRKAIRVDLALAHYLADQKETASKVAQRAAQILGLEPHRVLMVNYLLLQLIQDQRAMPMLHRSENGLNYWLAEATRFAHTPYGVRLNGEISIIQQLLEKDGNIP